MFGCVTNARMATLVSTAMKFALMDVMTIDTLMDAKSQCSLNA